jgi:hypothetical protein
VNRLGVSEVDVNHMVFVSSCISQDSRTIICVIICEFTHIKTSNLNLAHWFRVLRNFRPLGILRLEVEFSST